MTHNTIATSVQNRSTPSLVSTPKESAKQNTNNEGFLNSIKAIIMQIVNAILDGLAKIFGLSSKKQVKNHIESIITPVGPSASVNALVTPALPPPNPEKAQDLPPQTEPNARLLESFDSADTMEASFFNSVIQESPPLHVQLQELFVVVEEIRKLINSELKTCLLSVEKAPIVVLNNDCLSFQRKVLLQEIYAVVIDICGIGTSSSDNLQNGHGVVSQLVDLTNNLLVMKPDVSIAEKLRADKFTGGLSEKEGQLKDIKRLHMSGKSVPPSPSSVKPSISLKKPEEAKAVIYSEFAQHLQVERDYFTPDKKPVVVTSPPKGSSLFLKHPDKEGK
ncbi:MAG: hypothetical protein P4L16_03785 [Chlamydiales bacterium]|nr:hypothetical protein [Chlamydiales bacterium]